MGLCEGLGGGTGHLGDVLSLLRGVNSGQDASQRCKRSCSNKHQENRRNGQGTQRLQMQKHGRGAWGPVRTTDEWTRAATATKRREMTIFIGTDKQLSESRRETPIWVRCFIDSQGLACPLFSPAWGMLPKTGPFPPTSPSAICESCSVLGTREQTS